MKAQTPSLAAFKKQLGEIGTKAILTIIIQDVINFYNVVRPMSDVQIAGTIDIVLTEYWYLRPEDFKLCFNRAKTGKYGKVLDRMDGSIILSWIEAYVQERDCEIESYRLKEAKEKKILEDEERAKYSEIAKEAIKMFDFKTKETEKVDLTIREKTEAEKLVDEIIREFDKEHMNNPVKINGENTSIRMIRVSNQNMTTEDYVNYKLNPPL